MPRADVATAEHRRGELADQSAALPPDAAQPPLRGDRCTSSSRTATFPGPLHLSIGQEAVAVGGVLRACGRATRCSPPTAVTTTAWPRARRPTRLMAELLGRTTGYSRGRGGSMHVAVPEIGLLGTNGIVGGGIPIATGAAYGLQTEGTRRRHRLLLRRGRGRRRACSARRSTSPRSGALPLIFICENNQYVELTPQSVHVAGEIHRARRGATACPACGSTATTSTRSPTPSTDAVAARARRRGPDAHRGASPTAGSATTPATARPTGTRTRCASGARATR